MNPVTVILCVLAGASVARARILFPYEEELLLREGGALALQPWIIYDSGFSFRGPPPQG